MEETNSYNRLRDLILKKEIQDAIDEYNENEIKLNTYLETGSLLNEAAGKYGQKIIDQYSKRLEETYSNDEAIKEFPNIKNNAKELRKMYMFYRAIKNGMLLSYKITWGHYKILLNLDDLKEKNYYIKLCESKMLSIKSLKRLITKKNYQNSSLEQVTNVMKYDENFMDYIYKRVIREK